jgi:aldehyde:ferredoxin oxidoreductase
MLYGYTGKILHVNLNSGFCHIEEPEESFYRTYFGGSAMGLYYLLKNSPAGSDPLGPENTLAFILSAATGAPVLGQSRVTVVAKSPLTNAVGDSQAGGFFPAELKFAGFDGIVITGAARSPVYLWIKDGSVEIRDASHLWGHITNEAQAMLVEELGDPRVEIAQIGPAGEKLVRFAAIINMSNRANGRTGMGAVMGSKNLKAIAVRGTDKKIRLADAGALKAFNKNAQEVFAKDGEIQGLSQYGTAEIVPLQDLWGGLPTQNWHSGHMGPERADAISGERMYDEILRGASDGDQKRQGRDTCFACSVRCKRVVASEWQGKAIRPQSGGPEYETLATFGSYCSIDNLNAVAYANQLCNQYGVDTISAGATMAFAMECFENGLITLQDTGGIALNWGNSQAMVALLEKTLKREGIGDILAEGSARAAAWIGNGAQAFVMASKQQEIPAHMPHVKRSLALIYAVNPFGPDHQSSEHDPSYEPEWFQTNFKKYGQRLTDIGLTDPQDPKVLNQEKVRFALITQYAYSVLDTANVCQFVFGPGWQLLGMRELAEFLSSVTGWEFSIEDLLKIGARRLNMLRAFNCREGFTRDKDSLPKRFFDEPLQGGESDGISIDRREFEAALEEYYRQAGWDLETGNPHRVTLENLGLGWIADELGI